jgi:GH43 family beta-xylosidase
MSAERDAKRAETYLNPVHARDFPDPFVLKFAGEYFAYCTGFWHDARCFGMMRSRDLVGWTELAGAMEPLPGGHTCYWAPEVSYRDGKFLMYYSVGNETLMQVRVAVAERAEGPFVDSGHTLTHEEFAIDPHVFVDEDGARYLFYATDFLTHTHVGTGTVVDRMLDDFTLEGRPRPVTRARFDWQVYDPERKEKKGVRWHTVEGAFVLKRKGRYYEMFSGGNWQNISYGVSYAVSDRILRDDEWEQHADGVKVLPILRTIPEKVVGPGHNSVVRGPDNQQLFCVYHRWTEQGRVLAIDRQEFVGDSLNVWGPTTTPQPAPIMPTFADYFDEPRDEGLGEGWECKSGRWSVRRGEARQEEVEGVAEARCAFRARSFVAELNLRAFDNGSHVGAFGVCVSEGESSVARLKIVAAERRVVVEKWDGGKWSEAKAKAQALPEVFNPNASHLLRVEADENFLRFALDDGITFEWQGAATRTGDDVAALRLSLFSENCRAAFAGVTLARGFADEFVEPLSSLARGWKFVGAKQVGVSAGAKLDGKLLRLSSGETVSRSIDVLAGDSYELVLNVKIDIDGASDGGSDGGSDAGGRAYVLSPGVATASGTPLNFALESGDGESWSLRYKDDGGDQSLALPSDFAPREFQQFRFRRERERLIVQTGAQVLGEVAAASASGSISIAAGASPVALDMVRLTVIKTA